ncbi:hypothetical protein ABDK00_014250 [Niabella insulamsoli]|uniref:hypothetical protein n=1 Tax=Niabella insulamsoli TaxID=3144874 RepID=UPI0031FD27DF
MSNQSAIEVSPYSFEKGYRHIPQIHQADAIQDLMVFLKITSVSNLYRRMRGEVEPKVSEKEGIERIINGKYKVAKKNIWGA